MTEEALILYILMWIALLSSPDIMKTDYETKEDTSKEKV